MSSNVRPESMARINTEALAQAFIEEQVKALREQIGDKKVLLALSGGVDSSVVAALLIKAVGRQLVCVHVNHGLLRKGEPEQVIEVFRNQMNANLVYVDAVERFLTKLEGVSEPEQKRKIIARNSSACLKRKPASRKASNSWRRAPFIPTFWKAAPSRPITMWAACPKI